MKLVSLQTLSQNHISIIQGQLQLLSFYLTAIPFRSAQYICDYSFLDRNFKNDLYSKYIFGTIQGMWALSQEIGNDFRLYIEELLSLSIRKNNGHIISMKRVLTSSTGMRKHIFDPLYNLLLT